MLLQAELALARESNTRVSEEAAAMRVAAHLAAERALAQDAELQQLVMLQSSVEAIK